MSRSILRLRIVYAALVSLTLIASVFAQQPTSDQSEVIRISTELVQAGVVVLDKQGRFVEGLKPEQFLLRVDGKPVTPAFFEHVIAGTMNEEKLETAIAHGPSAAATAPIPAGTSYRGRTIVFFIDDLHLSAPSLLQTRKTILEFIENQMGPDDQVAIASPSGQIGFLQRFTDTKAVMRAALARLNHRPYTVRDSENITMTEYQALRIDQGDRDAINYYSDELLKATNFNSPGGGLGPPRGGPANATRPSTGGAQPNGMTREMAERSIKERALVLLKQSSAVSVNTLTTLESLMRSSAQMTGRKLVFFISDGFYLNDRNTAFGDKLKQITDAAIRAGVVIYTIDARGLVSETDASSNRADSQGRLSRSNIGELAASQDPLTALAGDTGGRALLNSGALSTAVTNALKETSNYYLLAWRPPTEEQKGGNFKRIEVSIVGRPELTVRLPRGFMSEAKTSAQAVEVKAAVPDTATPSAAAAKGPEAALIAALGAPSARKGLPTQLSVSFVDVPNNGPVLTASTQMATDVLGYGADGKQMAAVDLAGVVLNDQGKQAGSFKTRVNVNPSAAAAAAQNPGVIYSHKLPLKPGIYQVRVAARDDKSGRVGSAAKWIEIPDLAAKRLTLSSLLVGGQVIGSSQKQAGGEQMQFSVDRRFLRGSHLNFLTIIYNAAPAGNGAPELDAQIQISRNGQAVVTSPLRKVVTDANTDLARIVYGGDIALQTLPAGRYLLQVTISDRIARTSAAQQVSFDIE
ncbi:MAG TPA: VWA domain-containing protein [Pyrinomonadaceae bacterium]|jgi:VWFA-related protein